MRAAALVVLSMLLFAIIFLFENIEPARIAFIVIWWFTMFFYEPLLVWRVGATLGHYLMNLHVVDNETEGNISLPKALIRSWIKVLLGLFSFLTMSLSRRHQALHDIVTNASVRIRAAAKAQPYHYVVGRASGA